ncbi:MAG TPA: GNAT family N-acetyltransferase [Acidimicrobiales bacterium]|nr:GNAT family N-acetyltransferase [Acidimicrobiales bacterium]
MEWLVRRIRPDEGDRLRDIRLRALRDAPSAFASTFEAESTRPPAAWAERATAWSTGDSTATFIAEADRRWVGLIGALRVPDEPGLVGLVSMWVAPESRRLGIAQRLIGEVVTWAGSIGACAVELWVARDNTGAIATYQRAGFVPTADHQPLPSNPCVDELRMVLRLEADAGD